MPQFNWSIFSYIGLFFAIIYRFPQISKIYRTKSAEDLSSYSYLTHNGAYISFILYLVGSGKTDEWILCLYYFLGLFQNFLIFAMKLYYSSKKNKIDVNSQDPFDLSNRSNKLEKTREHKISDTNNSEETVILTIKS